MLGKEFDFFVFCITDRKKPIDFAHVRSLFLEHNDKVLKHKSTIQQKKFNDLLNDKRPRYDPEKIIYNYSSYNLSEAERSLLLKGLKKLIMLISWSISHYFTEIFVTLRFFLLKKIHILQRQKSGKHLAKVIL